MDEPVYRQAVWNPTPNTERRIEGLYTCSLCGGAVAYGATGLHDAWHRTLFKTLSVATGVRY